MAEILIKHWCLYNKRYYLTINIVDMSIQEIMQNLLIEIEVFYYYLSRNTRSVGCTHGSLDFKFCSNQPKPGMLMIARSN